MNSTISKLHTRKHQTSVASARNTQYNTTSTQTKNLVLGHLIIIVELSCPIFLKANQKRDVNPHSKFSYYTGPQKYKTFSSFSIHKITIHTSTLDNKNKRLISSLLQLKITIHTSKNIFILQQRENFQIDIPCHLLEASYRDKNQAAKT